MLVEINQRSGHDAGFWAQKERSLLGHMARLHQHSKRHVGLGTFQPTRFAVVPFLLDGVLSGRVHPADIDAVHPYPMFRQGCGSVLGDSGERSLGRHIRCKEWKPAVNHDAEDIDAGSAMACINAVPGKCLQREECSLGIWVHDRVPLIGCCVQD